MSRLTLKKMNKPLLILTTLLLSACSVSTLQLEHSRAYKNHTYITDMEQYGVLDKWVPSLVGDCEDYALYMRNKVGGQLLIVSTQSGEIHVVLNVNGIIIDNMSPKVYKKSDMPHKLIVKMTDEQIARYINQTQRETSALQAPNANP